MRVLHIVPVSTSDIKPALSYGGIQVIVAKLAEAQRLAGIDAHILAFRTNPAYFQEIEALQIPYVHVGGLSRLNPLLWRKLLIEVNKLKPTIICFHSLYISYLTIMSLLFKKRCPWIFHAHVYPPNNNNFQWTLVKLLFSHKFNSLIGVSNSVTESWRQYFSSRIKNYLTIYNGIEFSREVTLNKDWPDFMGNISPGRPLIGFGGRMAPDKGLKEFIDVLPIVSRYLPDARFVWAGDGPLSEWAQSYASQQGLKGKLAFPGFIRNMEAFWSSLDFTLFTAPREAFCMSLLEPLSLGTIVVGYLNGSGSDELIIPEETGILLPWGHAEGLAREISDLWTNYERYQKISLAAKDHVRNHFSLGEMVRKCNDHYQLLILNWEK